LAHRQAENNFCPIAEEFHLRAIGKRNPAIRRGSSKSALARALVGLLTRLLLRLLPRLLAGLLTLLLTWLVALPALLRLALIILIHVITPKLTKCEI
jgi:hypothetical protein